MLTCREASRLASESLDRRLPLGKRLGLRLHVLMCRACARYRRQIGLVHDVLRRALEQDLGLPGAALSPEDRERILEAVAKETAGRG